jgi:rod shape-determining protein MreB
MIYADGQIVLQEPAMVALTVEEERVVAVGQEGRDMYGRHPEHIEVVRPLRDGVIADYEVTEAMLRYFFRKVSSRMNMRGPEVMLSVTLRRDERRKARGTRGGGSRRGTHGLSAAGTAAGSAGRRSADQHARRKYDLNLGGGASEAAVLAMNGIVVADSVRMGGQRLDEAIINYIRRKYSLVIGEPTAESIKIQIGAAVDIGEELSMEIQGRDQVGGLPRTITVTTSEVVEAIEERCQPCQRGQSRTGKNAA